MRKLLIVAFLLLFPGSVIAAPPPPDIAKTVTFIFLADAAGNPRIKDDLLPKAKAARPDVPVIMITAYGDAETKRKALANGVDAFLTKPIDFAIVRDEIDIRLGHAA